MRRSLSAPLVIAVILLMIGAAAVSLATPRPHFLIDSEAEWNEAIANGHVFPPNPVVWSQYMNQWELHLVEGPPYPPHQFLPSELSVWGEGEWGGIIPSGDAGLVMAWGDRSMTGNFASAWMYDYGPDPDLSNSTITIGVTAPQFDLNGNQINVVSFGIQEIDGDIRAWYWNVGPGGPIQWNTPTTITINTALVGIGAANPPATSFANNPLFDITKSQFLIVDENGAWVGGPTPVPPPGTTNPRLWNYWSNLVVTPHILPKTTDPLKWSQPPVEFQPGLNPPVFYGWDEPSMYYQGPPMVADDWKCTDPRPVTDIHWWGSFLGWTQPDIPAYMMPQGFHLAIWTDVPVSADNPFSHPGRLVWENFCTSYQWNFAGYDKDPRGIYENEACFQFFQKLKPEEWFYQDPGPTGQNVYWLSIAAIYTGAPDFQWGWKTRPHFFNDDAVRIWQILQPDGTIGWPPTVGSMWMQGQEILLGQESWDLAFELTTNEELPSLDWGDAPDGVAAPQYPTLAVNNGANHVIVTGVYLGALIDAEPDGQPDATATGDDINGSADEDGVVPTSPFIVGGTSTIDVTASVAGMIDAWVDYNADGDWADSGEQVFASQPVAAGLNSLSFTIPTTAVTGITFARVRFSTAGGLSYDGPATDGEVEDYEMRIESQVVEKDWGDAPDPTYPTLSGSNGASHVILPNLFLGATIDAEADGQPNATATGDDISGTDDEDGVVFTSALTPGGTTTVDVTASAPGMLNAWVDFNADGDWADAGEQIFMSMPLGGGLNSLMFAVPSSAVTGRTFARFRLSNAGGLSYDGPAPDGEVEDYEVSIFCYKWWQEPDLTELGFDVNATEPYVLADDFLCTTTGPLTDIHIWGSWWHDILPKDATGMDDPSQVTFRLSIHSDIPVGGEINYSRPGNLLWYREFQPGQFTVRPYRQQLQEGWLDPPTLYEPSADTVCWQYDFDLDPTEFSQEGSAANPIVYWLDVQAVVQGTAASGCILPDNGSGTADLPPVGCAYHTPDDDNMRIIDGLQPGDTIEIDATHTNFFCSPGSPAAVCSFPTETGCREPGGSLGGEKECFESLLLMPMEGTGSLTGFNRMITLPVSFETHVGPRTLGDPVQSFDTDMFRMQGEVFGDPDFDLLRVTAGTDFGMPSPGHTTLTRLPSGDWSVDSFFDITYQIDFEGAPGSVLDGLSGSTTGTIRFQTSSDGGPTFGWKTAKTHRNDDAVWGDGMEPYFGPWNELRYPPNHPYYGKSIDLAFAITGDCQHPQQEIDWGDAPDPTYPTLAASNGANHVIVPGIFMGALIDAEPNGQPNLGATGDDIAGVDDEDGVVFVHKLIPGLLRKVQVTASVAGMLDAWVDFNADGDWADAGEQIFASAPLAAGVNVLTYTVPAAAVPGITFARFRFSTVGGLPYDGPAPDGEVEDYMVRIYPKPIIVTKGKAKLLLVGAYVLIEKNVVTANFGIAGAAPVDNFWYFEEPDRSAGLGVLRQDGSTAQWAVNDLVSCYGQTTLNGCELMLSEIDSWHEGDGVIKPVGQNNRNSGGGCSAASLA